MENEDTRKWAWGFEGDENAHGPFDSREEAIDDAHCYILDDQGPGNYEILVGRCDYFNPVERAKLSADADRFVEQMDEDEWGNGFEPDDAIYSMKEGAKKAFEEALGAWAFHYVYSNYWSLANDEKVNITVEDDEDEEVPTDPVHGERGGKEEEAAPKGNSE